VNCGGGVTDNGYNLSDDGSCGFSATGSANNATLNLGLLQNNGGSTLTHKPALNSNAVKRIPNGTTINNNGVTLVCNGTTTDQIGANRPIKVGDACTSGAVEVLDCTSVTSGGDLTLCINAANITPDTADTITLGANITLTADLSQISSPIRLEGGGYFVSGNNRWRMFYITSTGNFTLNQVIVQNGRTLGGLYNNGGTVTISSSTFSDNSAFNGGGLSTHNGTVTISSSTFSGNTATELYEGGGGIIIYNSTVTISNSIVSGNSGYYGGGIYNASGTVTISNSTVSGNSAGPSWGAGRGGGLDNRGTMTIINSTVSGNSGYYGGGLDNGGTMTITNSTVSGNSATYGGGLRNAGGTATITSSTISGNSASSGGGLYRAGGTIYLAGALLNTGASGVNCGGGVTDNGYNLSNDSSCGFSAIGSANNAMLNLGPLQNNGGSTLTHKPGSGSDAVTRIPNGTTVNNNGVTLACNSTTTDQTGAARPLSSGVPCTSGAVEVLDCSSVTSGGVLAFCINLANASPATPDTITLAANITLTANLPVISSPITLEGGGYSVSGSNTRQVFFVISTGNFTLNQVTVQDGRAYAFGGGLLNFEGTVTITNSTFSNNQATSADVIGGGGIYNSGTVTITNSTFSGNSAGPNGAAGGGLFNVGTAIITSSTFSGNTADFGGGLINYEGAAITISSSTFSGNSATYGGGLLNDGGTIYLAGMLLVNGASSSNCYGTPVTDNGYNLSDDGSCGFSATGSANSATLNLESLANNGGGTLTHKPSLDSDAIARIPNGTIVNNNGITLVCNSTTTDQTGASRPLNAGEACTSGAVEVVFACPSAVTTEGELRVCINLANASPDTHDTVILGENITLTADLPAVSSPITLEGGGYFVSGNNAQRVFSVASTGTGSFTLNNVSVQNGNAGADNGGGMSVTSGTVNIINSTFSSSAAENGGGLYNQGGTVTITNSTVSGNSAANNGGGIYNGGAVTLNNSILANSANGVDCSSAGGTVNAQHSLIEDGLGCVNGTNTGNLTGDPALNSDLTLTEFSSAVNTGDNDLVPSGITTDLAGNARIIGGIVDMGAYESPYITTVTIEATDDSAAETGGVDNGTFRISRGAATNGVLTVSFTKDGTATDGSDYTLGTSAVIPDGQTFVEVTLTAADDGSSAEPDETVILTITNTAAYDPGTPSSATVTINRNGVTCSNANDDGEGSLRQAVDNANTFDGGTITFSGVSAITLGSPIEVFGNVVIDGANTLTISASGFRAFSIANGTVVLKGLTISGGGVDVSGGNVTIGNDPVFIIGNNTTVCGGGLHVGAGTVTVQEGIHINGNTTTDNGGGVCVDGTGVLIVQGTGTQIDGNSATLGGGIYAAGVSVTVQTSASVSGNTAGGGIYHMAGDLSITDSYIQQNTGGAIRFADGGVRSVTGTCIVLNSDTAVVYAGGSGVDATGNWWGSTAGPFSGLSEPEPNDGNTVGSYGDSVTPSTNPLDFNYALYQTTAPSGCFACTTASAIGGLDRSNRICPQTP
jgi:fibronectin-binding autotransporter adhesin